MDIRKFAAEGSLHLYSSQANPLCPSELYLAEDHPEIRAALELCNLYLITRRKRIAVDPNFLSVDSGWLTGRFLVQGPSGWEHAQFRYQLQDEHHAGAPDQVDVDANAAGSAVAVINIKGQRILIPTYVLVAHAECDLGDLRDLDVLYVGIGIGRIRSRLAVDRLVAHAKLQRILAETLAQEPHAEVLLLMFRFEHGRMFISTGGDLTLEPTATIEEEHDHFAGLHNTKFDRSQRVALAEAALIKYFQPPYNRTFMRTDFAAKKRMKLLRDLDAQSVTGLIVEICTANIRSRLRSAVRPPASLEEMLPGADFSWMATAPDELRRNAEGWLEDVAHVHIAEIPLTTSEERNTFLHGMRWHNE